MHIHFVHTGTGRLSGIGRDEYHLLVELEIGSTLLSYHYRQLEKYFARIWNQLDSHRVIIDSGAFSAFTTGKHISIEEYAEWGLAFEDRWSGRLAQLRFMNLDVIGDQEESWVNQAKLERLGLEVIPIITYGAEIKHLKRAIGSYDLIALGGLVPHASKKKELSAWLDFCFREVVAYYEKVGLLPKIHLLGITSEWITKRYPCYSSDSSSWSACLRFGRSRSIGVTRVPPRSHSPEAENANLHTLRAEINRMLRIEKEATELWKYRGIVFDD